MVDQVNLLMFAEETVSLALTDRFAKNTCDYALEHIQEFKPDMMMKKLYTIIDAL